MSEFKENAEGKPCVQIKDLKKHIKKIKDKCKKAKCQEDIDEIQEKSDCIVSFGNLTNE